MREHYNKEFDGEIDIYRICRLYDINDPAIYHAVKKILRFGDSSKSKREDIKGAIVALERWLEMEQEDREDLDLQGTIDEKVEGVADDYKAELVDRVGIKDNMGSEEKRDILYDVLQAMDGSHKFIKDNLEREIWDINWLCNHAEDKTVDHLLEEIKEMDFPLNYNLEQHPLNMSEKEKLLEDISGMDSLTLQPFIYEVSKESNIPDFPTGLGAFTKRNVENWLKGLNKNQLSRLREIVETVKTETPKR